MRQCMYCVEAVWFNWAHKFPKKLKLFTYSIVLYTSYKYDKNSKHFDLWQTRIFYTVCSIDYLFVNKGCIGRICLKPITFTTR